MAIFHYTIKIVGRSKGKSVISASAYLNGDVMKNEETGRISYYTSKKEVVYTSLMMCENVPPEWQIVLEENIKRFQKSVRYKRSEDKEATLEKFKITFQKQRLWNEVLKIEKNADAQLGRSFEFVLPKEWNRQEQIQYTTDYIQKTFVDRGMCADWSIHDKGDGNPHVHLLLTMRPFNPDHSWGKKEVKDWDFVRDKNGNIVIDESHPNWWQDKKNPDRHGIRIPVLDENGIQKIGARNRLQWKRVLTDATGWNNPKNCELWRSEWAKVCNEHLPLHNQVDHRSYEKQGKLQIPTIHEGADARKIEQKFLAGQEIKGSWKVAENQIIKQQNTLLQKILDTFGKVSGALSLWKERLNDIRRKPGNYTLNGIHDWANRRTADLNGRNDSGNAESGHPTLSYAGTESEIAKIKQRVIRAAQHFAKYRGTAFQDGRTETVLFILAVWSIVLVLSLLTFYFSRKKYLNKLLNMTEQLEERYLLPEIMQVPERADEQVFYQIMKMAEKSMLERIGEVQRERREYKEYIEQWIHEVKTPITAMKLLCENNRSPFSREVLAELENINQYTEQALYYARSEHAEKDYSVREVNLCDVVNSAIADNKYLLRQSNMSIQIDDIETMVYTDEKWVRFILNQIIGNAIKYHAEQPILHFGATKTNDKIVLSISDNGIGIPKSDLPRIFEKGFTGQNGRTGKNSTGIGLYLCKRLCDKLGIGLTAYSENRGTTISLIFQMNDFIIGVQG